MIAALLLIGGLLGGIGATETDAQRIRVDGGGGWAFPTNNLDLEETTGGGPNAQVPELPVNLTGGPHAYGGIGAVWSIGKKFELGARLRAHITQIRSKAACAPSCNSPKGRLRAATIEGRIIVTSPGWIHPYLLVGLGVVHTTLGKVQIQGGGPIYSAVSVVDAGGDVGLGASIPIVAGLTLDAEVRATGSLPGGKENAVTEIPLTLGLSYNFE